MQHQTFLLLLYLTVHILDAYSNFKPKDGIPSPDLISEGHPWELLVYRKNPDLIHNKVRQKA
jgi:hypothetical protein